MIAFQIRADGLEQEEERLESLAFRVMDLMPIANTLAGIMYADNAVARLNSVDKDDQPFAYLAPATLEDQRRGPGPPLAPMETSSRIISGFDVSVTAGFNSALIVGSWPSMESFLGYHVTGTKWMPSRDPVGIRPSAWAEMLDAFDQWVDSVLAE